MERTNINPWDWSKAFGFSQAVQVVGEGRLLLCSGQTAIGADGSPPATDHMGEQVTLAFANLQTVLEAADMSIANVVRLTVFTTDIDALLADYGSAVGPLADTLPAMTLIGVTRLAYPELKVEIEAIAIK